MSAISDKIKSIPVVYKAGSLFVLLMIVAAFANWYSKPSPIGKQYTSPPPISDVKGIPKVPVVTVPIKVIPKPIAIKKIDDLPPEIKDDPDIEIADTADIPPSENGTNVVVTANTKTGDIKILAQEKDSPLFAFENKIRLGAGYGLSSEGNTGKVFAEWGFARVGSVHAAAQAELNATGVRSPEAKVMGIIYYAPRIGK